MHDICMATKTISLEIGAYEKLCQARREPKESFSNVVRRARWDDQTPNARALLEDLRGLVRRRPTVLLPKEALDEMERRRRTVRRTSRWQA